MTLKFSRSLFFTKCIYNAKKAQRQDNHNRKMNEPCDPSCPAAIQFMAMTGVEQQSKNAIRCAMPQSGNAINVCAIQQSGNAIYVPCYSLAMHNFEQQSATELKRISSQL